MVKNPLARRYVGDMPAPTGGVLHFGGNVEVESFRDHELGLVDGLGRVVLLAFGDLGLAQPTGTVGLPAIATEIAHEVWLLAVHVITGENDYVVLVPPAYVAHLAALVLKLGNLLLGLAPSLAQPEYA